LLTALIDVIPWHLPGSAYIPFVSQIVEKTSHETQRSPSPHSQRKKVGPMKYIRIAPLAIVTNAFPSVNISNNLQQKLTPYATKKPSTTHNITTSTSTQ
jgi:hypothetical protein